MLGKLVRINRAEIGVPAGSLGFTNRPTIYHVLMCGSRLQERRYLAAMLEEVKIPLDKENKI